MKKNGFCVLLIILLSSCRNSTTQSTTVKLTDSSKEKLETALDSLVASNSSPDDSTISGKFISQGKYQNGNYYITLRTKNDSLITMINLDTLKDEEIKKLKKDGDNITMTLYQ